MSIPKEDKTFSNDGFEEENARNWKFSAEYVTAKQTVAESTRE